MEDLRLCPQLAKVQVSSVGSVTGQEAEGVGGLQSAWLVLVDQLLMVQVVLGESKGWSQWGPVQQQPTMAWCHCQAEGEVGGRRVGVAELQLLGGDGLAGSALQAQAAVALQSGWDSVAVADCEVQHAAARRLAISHYKTTQQQNMDISDDTSGTTAVWLKQVLQDAPELHV